MYHYHRIAAETRGGSFQNWIECNTVTGPGLNVLSIMISVVWNPLTKVFVIVLWHVAFKAGKSKQVMSICLFYRKYLEKYLAGRDDINAEMTIMVRQMEATNAGLPVNSISSWKIRYGRIMNIIWLMWWVHICHHFRFRTDYLSTISWTIIIFLNIVSMKSNKRYLFFFVCLEIFVDLRQSGKGHKTGWLMNVVDWQL